MLKRPQFIALTVAILLALVLLNLPSQSTAQVKLFVSSIFLPIFGLAGSAEKTIDNATLRLTPREALALEVEKLRRENQALQLQSMQAQDVWKENTSLREALGWQRKNPWNLKLGRVINRDPANWWRNITIDLGARHGVTTNLPVLTAEGLIGKIDQVGFTSSRVVLLGDPNCRVAAMVENGEPGFIAPGGANIGDESIVALSILASHSRAQPGQRVMTSGMGGVFPRGIPIGQIIDTNSVGFGLYLEARVKLAADMRKLEMVWVQLPATPK